MEEDKWYDCNVEVLRTSSHIILILKKLLNLEVVKVEWKQSIENMWLKLLKIFKKKENTATILLSSMETAWRYKLRFLSDYDSKLKQFLSAFIVHGWV